MAWDSGVLSEVMTFLTIGVQRVMSEPLGVRRTMGTNERINGK